MLSRPALLAIGGYQRWLSPRKGFGCAHRLAHGGPGCSGFAQEAIARHGALAALPAIRQRLADCHAAAVTLRRDRTEGREPRRRRWYDGWDAGCTTLDCDCCGL